MALRGVIGDIHGNREALAAVLAALERRGVRELWCVGDIVGYNADPDECVALLRERQAVAIAGNHDLIGLGKLDFRRCSNKAMYSLKRTRRALTPDAAAYLATLPPSRILDDGVVLVHGGVRDVQQYMVAPSQIGENAAYLRADFPGARVCFFGHSHEQKVYQVDGDQVTEKAGNEISLDRNLLYFINAGSVDAARKSRHKLAECAILDPIGWTIEFLRVPYDAASSEAKAVVFGYRIPPWTDRFYTLRNKLLRRGAGI